MKPQISKDDFWDCSKKLGYTWTTNYWKKIRKEAKRRFRRISKYKLQKEGNNDNTLQNKQK